MSELTESNLEGVVAACRENCAAIAESLNLCFDRQYRIEIGETLTWTSDTLSAELDGPGLVTAIEVGEQAMVCLIPASLPLPAWYLEPSESEQSRLQTLAMEWSINLLPEDLTAGQFSTVALTNIKHEVTSWEPCEWAAAIELLVHEEPADEKSSDADAETDEPEAGDVVNDESSSAGAPPVAVLYLVWPVAKPPFPSEEEASSAVESAPQESVAEQPAPKSASWSSVNRKF
jgi:flagellar motor switch protein FliN/FliY